MNLFLQGMFRAVRESFELSGPILEIGSYQVAGQEDLINLRSHFPGVEYTGLDIRPGPGVDVVGSVETLPWASGSFGTVIAFSTFEHVRHFWRGFDEVHRVLRPGGAFLLSVPFCFHIHDYPSDYWRFTPDALKMLLEPYTTKLIGWQGPSTRPSNVWAIAYRAGGSGITQTQFARYRELMTCYAREPLPWRRRLLYQLGSLLCGRRPFAPWLQRDQWQAELVVSLDATEGISHAERRPSLRASV